MASLPARRVRRAFKFDLSSLEVSRLKLLRTVEVCFCNRITHKVETISIATIVVSAHEDRSYLSLETA